MSDPIDDKTLIIWFKRAYKDIEFIKHKPNYQRIDRFSRLKDSIGRLNHEKNLFEQKDLLTHLLQIPIKS